MAYIRDLDSVKEYFSKSGVQACDVLDDWWVDTVEGLSRTGNVMHLAVMREPFLTMLVRGDKTVESRFSMKRMAPYGRCRQGDLVLIKGSGSGISYYFTVSWSQSFVLKPGVIDVLERDFGHQIGGDRDFWVERVTKRYATLIGVDQVLECPYTELSKRDRRPWIDFGIASKADFAVAKLF
mgnify:CR=1 FL=1